MAAEVTAWHLAAVNTESHPIVSSARIEKSIEQQFARIDREMKRAARSGKGRDKAVHQLRKGLQRLRSMLRLLREVEPIRLPQLEKGVRGLRRRFSALRDAAVRLQLAGELARSAEPAVADQLAPVSDELAARLDALWQRHDEVFWTRSAAGLRRLKAQVTKISLQHVRRGDLEAALERERRRARKAILRALGLDLRRLRHHMRCRVRRYAAMRRLCKEWLGRRDALSEVLVELGRRLGQEGDLWLSGEAVHSISEPAAIVELRRQLRARRRQLVREHDGELCAWLRRSFAAREHNRPMST